MQKEKTSKPNNGRRKKTIILILSVAIAVGVPAWFIWDNHVGGPEYRAAKHQCGTKPVAGYPGIKRPSDRRYILPSDPAYKAFSSRYDIYFCTESQAIEAGYKKWVYSQ